MIVQDDKDDGARPAWRPASHVRAKVVAIAKHRDRLLVCEVLDDDGRVMGWCPMGGGIEFGEAAADALKREIREELGCEIAISGAATVHENIYAHHGITGHEIIFAFSVRFCDPQIYAKDRFSFREDKGSLHWAEWIDIARFRDGDTILYPAAIGALIAPA